MILGTGSPEVSITELGLLWFFLPGLSKVLVLDSEEEEAGRLDDVLTGGVGISEVLLFTLDSADFLLSVIRLGNVLDLNSPEFLLDSELVLVLLGVRAEMGSSFLDKELCLLLGGVIPGLLFR